MVIKEYKEYIEDEILRLYTEVGWKAYTDNPTALRRGYEHSLVVLAAYENDELLGIIRAVGDGFTVVFVQDILVFPEKQRQGIGTALMKALLARFPEVRQVEFTTDHTPQTKAFYQSLGFDELGEHGMLEVNLEKKNLQINFIKLDNREFEEYELDISEILTEEELTEKINNLNLNKNNFYKIILVGIRNFEINTKKQLKLINKDNILKIKNNTKIGYNLEELSKHNNLKGIFVKEMLELLAKEPEKAELIQNAIEIGLNNM